MKVTLQNTLNKEQEEYKENSGITDMQNVDNTFNRAIDFKKFSDYMNKFIKNDYKDGCIKTTYNFHRNTGLFNAFDTDEQVRLNTYLLKQSGVVEYKRIDKTKEVQTILGKRIIYARLIIFKKEDDYSIAGALCPMSLNVGYMPADDEITTLEIRYRNNK